MSILRSLGYAAFFVFSVLAGLYLTFPWEAVKDRLFAMAKEQSGVTLAAATLEPSWVTGLEATDLQVTFAGDKEPAVKLASATVRVSLLALLGGKLGVSAKAPIGNGQVSADVKTNADVIVLDALIDNVQLDAIPQLAEASGIPASGRLTIDAKLTIGKKDPKLTKGTVNIKATALAIAKGGKVGPLPLPPLELGDFALAIPFDEGKATFKDSRIKGTDLEIALDGTVSPLFPLARTTLTLTIGLKPTDKLLGADPLLRPLLNNFNSAKGADGFYGISVIGNIKHPRVQPQRRG